MCGLGDPKEFSFRRRDLARCSDYMEGNTFKSGGVIWKVGLSVRQTKTWKQVALRLSTGGDMISKRLFVFTLLALSTSLPFFKSVHVNERVPNLQSVPDVDLKTVTIKLERTECYGNCPAYSVTIHGDGHVEYQGKSNVKEKGAQEGRIELDDLRTLMRAFAKAKYWDVPADYSETKCKGPYCTDMATVITELTVRGEAHRVEHYYGCGSAPKSLFELESRIDKTVNSERWTGDVSNAGPVGTSCFGRR